MFLKIEPNTYILWAFLFFCFPLSAQVPLTNTTNTPRHDDILCKIEVPHVEQGESGSNVIWYLPAIPDDGKEYLQTINSNTDTIAVYEEGRIQHFMMRNDTLYDKGEQSRRAHKIYSQERPVMHYPFGYGDRIEGRYTGEGRYETLTYTIAGYGYTEADGMGVLTDGEDTLRHVIRLHMHDEYTLDYGQNLPLQHLVEERYIWYCTGYRYPVQEKWQLSLREGDILTSLDSTAFLYLPVMQHEDLAEDPENAQILEDLVGPECSAQDSVFPNSPFSAICAALSPDGMTLTLSYELDSDAPLYIVVSDIMGSILGYAHYASRPAGTWQEHINLSRRPVGGIVAINVECGTQSLTMKVSSKER